MDAFDINGHSPIFFYENEEVVETQELTSAGSRFTLEAV